MKKLIAIVAMLSLLVGFALGTNFRPNSPQGLRADSRAQMDNAGNANGKLAALTSKPNDSGFSPSSDNPVERLRAVSFVNSFRSGRIYIPLTTGGDLSIEFINVFGISLEERFQLKTAIEKAKNSLAQKEVSYAKFYKAADGTLKISIDAFPQEGKVIYEDLLSSVKSVLGNERYGFFLQISLPLNGLDWDIGEFGLIGKTYVVSHSKEWMFERTSEVIGQRLRSVVKVNQGSFAQNYPILFAEAKRQAMLSPEIYEGAK